MNPHLWAAYVALAVLLSFTPGPAVLTVIGQGVRHGWRLSLFGVAGILVGNGIYFTLSALGLGAFVAASPRLFGVLRWGGIGFLAWMGLRALFTKARAEVEVQAESTASSRALFMQAMTTQLANPKAIIFFVSILVPFLDQQAPWPPWAQVATYGVTGTLIEGPVLAAYGFAGAHGGRRLASGGRAAWTSRISGACLLTAATWLALR